jgi:acyl-CoA thioester hydrolase
VKFAVEVAVRWSDMDAYGHVNHARTVTLLEEARIELFHNEMPRHGLKRITDGIVVARLAVDYVAPVVFDGTPIRIELWVTEVKAASFTLSYAVRARADDKVVATAETLMVPYDVAAGRPRRLSRQEREFLALWTADGAADRAAYGGAHGSAHGATDG